LNRHPPETPAIFEFWQTPLIGGCVDFGHLHSTDNRFFSHDDREKPADYTITTGVQEDQKCFCLSGNNAAK